MALRVRRYSTGFSLVELSIVLVILGLLTGGILGGQSLIKASALRKTTLQVGKLDTAYLAFLDKYFCLPGDCSNATGFGFTLPTGCVAINGNGDRMLISYLSEGGMAGCVLSQTQSIDGLERTRGYTFNGGWALPPTIASIGSDGYQGYWWPAFMPVATNASVPSGHYYWLTTDHWATPRAGVLSTEDAYGFDMKLDDGKPRSGMVMATGSGSATASGAVVPTFVAASDANAAGSSANPQCTTNTLDYNVQNTNRSICSLTVKTAFR